LHGVGVGPVDLAAAIATVLSEFGVILWLILAADRPMKPGMQRAAPAI
jgi:hypothetical protein